MSAPRLDQLTTIPLFQDFAQDELAELAARFQETLPGKGGVLFEEGETSEAFYLLTRGEVTLEMPGEAPLKLRPPAVIGELGGVLGAARSARAIVAAGSEVWQFRQRDVEALFVEQPAIGIRLLKKLLTAAAEKVGNDQRRLSDMRANLVATQKALKSLRDLVLETQETPVSTPVFETLERLIVKNRRVNYRVAPPSSHPACLRLDAGRSPVVELSRTHVTVAWPDHTVTAHQGEWVSGIAELGGEEIAISGTILRASQGQVTLELDLLPVDTVAVLEGYLTRLQLLDIVV
ncbi:MAG: cyclic nucleotide-binding domain-containing protein [Myxococcales bacterium]|nr:cyclic nucleotide-binding domain-containing protein [Myxococcales bacterium]